MRLVAVAAAFFVIIHAIRGQDFLHLLEFLQAPNITVDADHIDGATCGRCGNSKVAGLVDTVSTISAFCDVPTDQTLAENPGLKLSSNISNMLLKIPCNSNNAQCGICGDSYTVQDMDTMDKIASTCGMQLLKLEMENQDVDFNNIDGNQLLRVPCRNHTPAFLHGCGICGTEYLVQKQQVLKNVSSLCGSTVDELSAANPGFNFVDESLLVPGQKINVPCHGENIPGLSCGPCGKFYISETGDNFDSVAAKCRVGFVELSKSNPGSTSSNLIIGTKMNIPCTLTSKKTASCLCNSTYVVTKNISNVPDVASHCNVTPSLISYANGISADEMLTFGQVLAVPCEESPSSELSTCSICGSSLKPTIMVNLVTVARICNTTSDKIKKLNNFSLESVGIGDSLLLPCEDRSAGCGPCGIAYKALPQDTLPSIAVKCATMPQKIQKANQDLDLNKSLISGKLISIPCLSNGKVPKLATAYLPMVVIISFSKFIWN